MPAPNLITKSLILNVKIKANLVGILRIDFEYWVWVTQRPALFTYSRIIHHDRSTLDKEIRYNMSLIIANAQFQSSNSERQREEHRHKASRFIVNNDIGERWISLLRHLEYKELCQEQRYNMQDQMGVQSIMAKIPNSYVYKIYIHTLV